jgi:hypothetical protein
VNVGTLRHKLGIFAAVPLTLLQDRRLNEKALRAYMSLASFEGVKDVSYPGLDKIAERAGLSLRATSQATRILKNAGWLLTTRRGRGLTNTYMCLSHSDQVKGQTRSDLQMIGKSRLADYRQARLADRRQLSLKKTIEKRGDEKRAHALASERAAEREPSLALSPGRFTPGEEKRRPA